LGSGFSVDHFVEWFVLPVVTTSVALVVRRVTKLIRFGLDDLAVGLDLIVGALFTLGLVAVQFAVLLLHRSALDWAGKDTWPVIATFGLLVTSGIVVRYWGWSKGQPRQLLILQGIVIPLVASCAALLLVVRQATG